MHILRIIRVCLDAINASNQRTIMFLYDISTFMLYFISENKGRLGEFIMDIF